MHIFMALPWTALNKEVNRILLCYCNSVTLMELHYITLIEFHSIMFLNRIPLSHIQGVLLH